MTRASSSKHGGGRGFIPECWPLIAIGAGVLLPLATYAFLRVWNESVAASASNPDQNAMVLMFLTLMGAVAIGAALLMAGLITLLVRAFEPKHDR